MQSNHADDMDVDVEDEGSLFGSPPPSPRAGRSPSPALALPSSSGSIVNLQNVGTIALPGSHHSSELPMNPLALPSSWYPLGAASRPPAQFQNVANSNMSSFASYTSSPASSSFSSTPSSSRASSQGPSLTQPRKKRGRSRRDDEPTMRPPPPEIPLPDPTAPPPVNWLRSQSALLGHAGLISGVKPATLSNRHSRGSTAVNPIVLADDERSQFQSNTPSTFKSFSPRKSPKLSSQNRPFSDRPQLPSPSIHEIVQILIKQKEIFPVLQDILKYIANGSSGPGFARRNISSTPTPTKSGDVSPTGPTPKKRKLNKVPAGAADWDVPYPFQQGEGPQAYHSTWEKDRGKQLISQLVCLIRAASRKAAMRKYLEKNQEMRLQLALLQSPKSQAEMTPMMMKEFEHTLPKDIFADASNAPTDIPNSSPSTPAPSQFDDLLSSLLTVTQSTGESDSSDLTSLFANTGSHEPTPELDPEVLDSWMSIFQTFPIAYACAPNDALSAPTPDRQGATSPLVELPFDFGTWSGFPDVPDPQASFSLPLNPSIISTAFDSSLSPEDNQLASTFSTPAATEFAALQTIAQESEQTASSTIPAQLNISIPSVSSSASSNLSALSGTPSLVHSPMPSISSFGDLDLLTPITQAGDWGLPEVAIASGQSVDDLLSTMDDGIMGGTAGSGGRDTWMSMEGPQGGDRLAKDKGKGKGKERQMDVDVIPDVPEVPLSRVLPALISSVSPPVTAVNAGTSSVFRPPSVRPFLPSDRTSDKAELLKRARERRTQLAEEIVKARTQLWETTIEHGVLTRLARRYT